MIHRALPTRLALRRLPVAGLSFFLLTLATMGSVLALSDAEVVAPTSDFSKPEAFEMLPAGALTSRKKIGASAFSHSSANMSFEKELDFKIGDGLFRRTWVSAPASTRAADGLGPLFNARACQRCHLKDGRGHPPSGNWPEDDAVSMFLRLSIPPQTDAERRDLESGRRAVIPEPTYGEQLQDLAIQGHAPEGRMRIAYTEVAVPLSGGEVAHLRKPAYTVTDLGYGPMHEQVMTSPRVAPPMIGLGLLEALSEDHIVAAADPEDADGNGISGKANRVWSDKLNRLALGRFGWKAGNATIEDQASGAFSGDIGISNPLRPGGAGECTPQQISCLDAPNGNSPRIRERRGAPGSHRSRGFLFPKSRGSGSARHRRLRGPGGKTPLLRDRLHILPSPQIHHAEEPAGDARAVATADLALHRPSAARHGRRSGRRKTGRPRGRSRMENASLVGHRPHESSERTYLLSARWTGTKPSRGGLVARRRSKGAARRGDIHATRGSAAADPISRVPVKWRVRCP